MSMLTKVRLHYRDIRYLGLASLLRLIQTPDSHGYTAVKTRFGTFLIRRSETDLMVLRQIFVDRDYDLDFFPQGKTVRRAYEDSLRRGRTPLIIDAGANAGFAARFFAAAYPKARILSVEPDPGNAAVCRENTSALPRVEVFEAAIGARAGHVTIERNDGGAWARRTHLAEAGVPLIPINDLVSRYEDGELLIVKVDIEGFERHLFSDATEWIERTCALIVEPHDWMLPGAGTSQTLQQAMLGGDRDILISGENLIWIKRS